MGWTAEQVRSLPPRYQAQIEEQLRAGRGGGGADPPTPRAGVVAETSPSTSPASPPPGPQLESTPTSSRPGAKPPNQLELRWELALRADPDVLDFAREPEAIHIADRCLYWPDYRVTTRSGARRFDEVKGPHCFEDSRIKFKAASRVTPDAEFRWVRWDPKSNLWRIESWKAGRMERRFSLPNHEANVSKT
jgi:hypothetical protein